MSQDPGDGSQSRVENQDDPSEDKVQEHIGKRLNINYHPLSN